MAFYIVLAFWGSKFWNNGVLSPPHPLFQCQNMIFFRENPVRCITRTLCVWTGYFGQGLSYPSPHILLKEFHWKGLCLFLTLTLCSLVTVLTVFYFIFAHPCSFLCIGGLDVFGPFSAKGGFDTVRVMSSAENSCVPSHLGILDTSFSSVAKEQGI